jgi:hypothetical protein
MTQTKVTSGSGKEATMKKTTEPLEPAAGTPATQPNVVAGQAGAAAPARPEKLDTARNPTELSVEELMSLDFAGC